MNTLLTKVTYISNGCVSIMKPSIKSKHMEFENKTQIECDGCGAKVAVLHDHEFISFCPVCAEDITTYDDDSILESDEF